MKSLRNFLDILKKEAPEEIIHVKKEILPMYETTAILTKLEQQNRFPVLIFDNVKGWDIPVVINVNSSRKRLALALDVTEEKLVEKYRIGEENLISPKLVNSGPVKEVISKGNEVDLTKFPPIITHHEGDGGPYITSGIVVAKDPETGVRNASYGRLMLISKNELRTHLVPTRHLWECQRKAEEKGRPLEIAIFMGAHPAWAIGSLSIAPFETDEYGVIGGIMGEPLEIVNCETVDLEVPATAEIVLEGEILPNIRELEGPFGEFTGHSTGALKRHVVKIKAITHRENPIYQDIGHIEHRLLGAVPREAYLYKAIKGVMPSVKAVHMPISGCCRFHCYISISKKAEGQAKNVIFAALGTDPYLKHVVVVDDDVDVYNETEVLWAISTRVQADEDVFIVTGGRGSDLDPSAKAQGIVTKVGIDATRTLLRPFPSRLKIPETVMNKMKLEDYLG
ncbi:Phenolic acid decarboxylase [subsurface metagenome]